MRRRSAIVRQLVRALRLLGHVLFAAGNAASWLGNRLYRLSGRCHGYSYEVSKLAPAAAPVGAGEEEGR